MLVRSRRREAGLAYGRRRAAERVRAGRFQVHPGWRGRVPAQFEVVTDQVAALERTRELVEAEDWCERRRQEAAVVLAVMVWAMDWRTGLVTGVTREHLAARVGRSTRSVSRLWAWAQDVGLLARVEEGADKRFLGASSNRAAAFVVVAPVGWAADRAAAQPMPESPQLSGAVDKTGNLPVPYVRNKPLGRRELRDEPWPARGIPATPAQRRAGAEALLTRTGLDRRLIDPRRLHGLLRPWWDAGACVSGLVWMLDHHPDQPDQPRGCATRSAHDPLAVFGYRLAPWIGRTCELPEAVRGLHGDYRAAQKTRLAALLPPEPDTPTRPARPSSAAVRAAAQAALREHLTNRRRGVHLAEASSQEAS
jgi:hypothetical protein